MEKEHRVLKEQLKEAQDKHEQLEGGSSGEVSALKEQLKKSVEKTEVMFLSVQQWGKLRWPSILINSILESQLEVLIAMKSNSANLTVFVASKILQRVRY